MKSYRVLFPILVLTAVALMLGASMHVKATFAQDGQPLSTANEVATAPDATGAALPTAFTYQGNLKKSGQTVSATCSFQFSLWNALTGGTQQGTTQTVNNVRVQAGIFTVQLNFGNHFTGEARWLKTGVKCPDDKTFTPLSPRQPLTAAPYALGLRPGATVNTTAQDVPALTVNAPAANANALVATGTGDDYAVIFAEDKSEFGGFGLYGKSENGTGVYGKGDDVGGTGIHGEGAIGMKGEATGAFIGVIGFNRSSARTGRGVYGAVLNQNAGASSVGVSGYNNGSGPSGIGVWGEQAGTGYGVYGSTRKGGYGVVGESPSPGYAGYFKGNVHVTGTFSKGAGAFKIDHPLDPTHKYLSHSFVESPDMMNIYNGNVTTDGDGFATVTLPDWFEALNGEYRYQLTVIGKFAQVIVADEIEGNQFRIQTDKPLVKVSWQVTGIRHDPFAEANRITVEEEKSSAEQGHYLYPDVYGKRVNDSVWYATSPNFRAVTDSPDAAMIDPLRGEGQ